MMCRARGEGGCERAGVYPVAFGTRGAGPSRENSPLVAKQQTVAMATVRGRKRENEAYVDREQTLVA